MTIIKRLTAVKHARYASGVSARFACGSSLSLPVLRYFSLAPIYWHIHVTHEHARVLSRKVNQTTTLITASPIQQQQLKLLEYRLLGIIVSRFCQNSFFLNPTSTDVSSFDDVSTTYHCGCTDHDIYNELLFGFQSVPFIHSKHASQLTVSIDSAYFKTV